MKKVKAGSGECDDMVEKRRRVNGLVNCLEAKAYKAAKKKSSKSKNDFLGRWQRR